MGAQLNRSPARSKLAALARGRRAESVAALWLMLKGYRILARRHKDRLPGAGEIDLVARKGDVIAFVEVKRRGDLASAAFAIGPRQRRRLAQGAAAFLARRPQFAHLSVRFDALLLAPGRWPHHMIDAWREPD
jgi:putative endonuclease